MRGDVVIAMRPGAQRLEQIERQIIPGDSPCDACRFRFDRPAVGRKDRDARAAILHGGTVVLAVIMRRGERGEIGVAVGHSLYVQLGDRFADLAVDATQAHHLSEADV